jgi:pilus assembly protein CpaC
VTSSKTIRRFTLLLAFCLATGMVRAQVAAENQSLHIIVGRSIVLNSEARFTRIAVGNPTIIESVATSPNQTVITAKLPGSSSLILWDQSGRMRVFDVYADIDVTGLREAIQQSYPNLPVQVDGAEGKVILTGVAPAEVIDQFLKMAAPYSKEVVNSLVPPKLGRQKQIMLKVRFAEVDRAKVNSFGINILSTGAANTPGTISTQQFGNTSLGGTLAGTIGAPIRGTTSQFEVNDLLNIFLFRPELNLGAAIKALQQQNALQILAEPNLLSLSGETARFLAGGEFPYPVVQAGGGTSTVTIQFRPYGVKLEFTGTVDGEGANQVIRLKVVPEVSALDYGNSVTISGFLLPAISTRRAETQVELQNGQSFGIAGLIDDRTTVQMSKIPGIGDIPILGHLFRSRTVNRTNTELLVLVTPVIVDPLTTTATPASIVTPITPLDSGKFDKELPGKKK